MVFQSPGTVFLKLGSLTIRWYGVMIALGFALSTFVLARLAKKTELRPEIAINCALVCFIGGVAGARLYFVALNWTYFQFHLQEICATWLGGMSIHGGLIGGTACGIIYALKEKISIPKYADLCTAVMPLGQAIGRFGNFFNSEAFGRPVPDTFPLKLFIPSANRPERYLNYNYFHPTFLYESLWDLALFLGIYFFLFPRLSRYPGIIAFVYLAGYSLGRLLIEPIRLDSIMYGVTPVPIIASAISLAVSIAAIPIIFIWHKRQ